MKKNNDNNKVNKFDKFWLISGSILLALFTFIVVMA